MTSREAVRATLLTLLEDEMGEPFPELGDDQDLRANLGLDSVDVVGLVMRVEREFRVRLSPEELAEVKLVGDLLDLMDAKLSARGEASMDGVVGKTGPNGAGDLNPVRGPSAPSSSGRRSPSDFALAGDVVGHGLARFTRDHVADLRKRPGPIPAGWGRVPPSLLRYSDEQTIAGVVAVFTAIERMRDDPARFAEWGVVAAPRFLGRSSLAKALERFDAEGVWGTSPHLIPHFALHSQAGTISLALGIHGPNLGVGGRASRPRRRVARGPDLAVDRRRARRPGSS